MVSYFRALVAAIVHVLTPERTRVYSIALSAAIVGIIVVGLFAERSFFYTGDFIVFYTGGKFILTGRTSELYNFALQKVFQAETLGIEWEQLVPFVYPPHAALLSAPFAIASYELGVVLWSLAGLAAFVFAWHLLARELTLLTTIRMALLSFCFFPTIVWFFSSQNTAFSFLIYSAFFLQLRKGRDFSAGAALGLLLYKPQLMLIPGFLLLIKRRRQALMGCFLTSLASASAGFLLSPEMTWKYVGLVPELARLPFSLPQYPVVKMHNFYGFCILLFRDLWSTRAIEALAGILMLAGLMSIYFWWRTTPWRPKTKIWDLTAAATFALGLLISPHLMTYDLLLLLLPGAIVWHHYPKLTDGRQLDAGSLLVMTGLVYIAAFVSEHLSSAMLKLSVSLGYPACALQLSVLSIISWVACVRRATGS